jgi:hypothetical protein
MGKRGPKPTVGPRAVLSTTVTPELRASIEAAAKSSGLTISREVETRLKRTFIDDEERIPDLFGDAETYWLLRVVAICLQMQQKLFGSGHWLTDPNLFNQAIETVRSVLEAVRPSSIEADALLSDAAGPYSTNDVATTRRLWGEKIALMMWHKIQKADPSLPVAQGDRLDAKTRLFRSQLGDIAHRARASDAESDSHRKRVQNFARSRKRRKK